MGLRVKKKKNLHTWWYQRPSSPTGSLPKIAHTRFIFNSMHSWDKLSHDTNFHQNRLKNKKVEALSPPLCWPTAIVRKGKCPKLRGFK